MAASGINNGKPTILRRAGMPAHLGHPFQSSVSDILGRSSRRVPQAHATFDSVPLWIGRFLRAHARPCVPSLNFSTSCATNTVAGSRPNVSTQPQRSKQARARRRPAWRSIDNLGLGMMARNTVDAVDWCDESPDSVLAETNARSRTLLLGLPCSRCRAYYEAQLTTCPICGCSERVSPREASRTIRPRSRAA